MGPIERRIRLSLLLIFNNLHLIIYSVAVWNIQSTLVPRSSSKGWHHLLDVPFSRKSDRLSGMLKMVPTYNLDQLNASLKECEDDPEGDGGNGEDENEEDFDAGDACGKPCSHQTGRFCTRILCLLN